MHLAQLQLVKHFVVLKVQKYFISQKQICFDNFDIVSLYELINAISDKFLSFYLLNTESFEIK